MYWEEKIDRLKKETDPTDFKVPFTDWSTILKKIEDNFIIKENSDFIFSNWDSRLKEQRRIKKILTANIVGELDKFDSKQSYWIVLTRDKADFKNLVYDSKPTVIKILSGLWDGDFYIVDKKYNWLTYFKRNNTDIEVFKSGDFATPLDNNVMPAR
jgi:hypothetical protein